jgi:hypothetical protein
MKIGDLVEATGQTHLRQLPQRGILTNLSDCGTMAWVAWMHSGMKETRIPTRYLKVIA